MSEQHSPAYSLSAQELLDYQSNGYLIRRNVFGADELVSLREAVEAAVQHATELCEQGDTYHLDGKRFVDVGTMTVQFEHCPGSQAVRVIEPVHQLHPRLEQLVDDPRIVAPMRSIIGQEHLSVWTNKLNLKRAGVGSGFGWHQDSPYWIHDSSHVDLLPNVYLAFDDADEQNGCLKVIRGSHLRGCLPGRDDGSQLGGFFTSTECFDEADAVAMTVPSGSLVFFDPHSIHGSAPNDSSHARRAIIMTYQPGDYPMLKTGQIRNVQDAS